VLALAPASAPAAAASHYDGTIYVQSNRSQPGRNTVMAFRYREGRILKSRGEYKTGGSGSHDLSNSGALDIEGSIATTPDDRYLFAVNAGSDTVAVFKVASNGGLRAVAGSPFASQGKAPASVAFSGGHLFVANKAHDGVRDLRSELPSYASFAVSGAGRLTPVGTPQTAPPRASPTQAFVTPDGGLLLGSDEQGGDAFTTGRLRAYLIGADGSLTPGPGTPQDLDPAILGSQGTHQVAWAQGLVARPAEHLVYAGVANRRLLIVYRYDAAGNLTFVRSMPNKGSQLPCWNKLSKDGRYLYSGNAGNNSMSVFDLKNPERPKQIQTFALKGGGNPWNFTLDPSGRHIFLVDMRAVAQIPANQGNELHSLKIGKDGKLSEPNAPVKIPVPTGTNPWGISVVPH
jgi:6-phosphogluconolactonase (cycloisomerase 2 family)